MVARLDSSVMKKGGSHYWLLWAGILVADLFMIGVIALVIAQNRQRAFDEAAAIGENYARTIEENFIGFIRRIDVTLLTVADEVARQRASGGIKDKEFEAFLARQDKHIAEARGLRVMDVAGNIRYAVSGVNIRGANIGDRPYFIRVRDDPNAGLVISEPIMGRASNMPVVTLSRRIANPDGSFAGEVNVAVAIDRFVSMLSLPDLGQNGSDSLWSKARLIARYAKDDPAGAKTGTPLPSSQLRDLIGSDKKTGWYHIVTRLDNVERIYQFRQLGDYPLYVVIGLADADFLAKWRDDSIRLAGLAVAFVVSTLLFGWLTHRVLRHRDRAEAALRVEETKYRSLFENANDGIFLQDATGFVDCNKRGAEMYGLTREEVVGRSPASLCPERQPDGRLSSEVAEERMRAALAGVPQYFEWQPIRADGSTFDVGITLNRVNLGDKSYLQSIVRDITEGKRAEAKIQALNAELEDRVRSRTTELEVANANLIRARDAAEAANRAKSIFLANMSHELRTPLNAVLGFAQLLERDPAIPEDCREQVATIGRSGNHLLSLINDVLEISRLEAGRMSVHDEAFDLGAVLAAVEEMIRIRTDAKGLALVFDRAADLPAYVVGDAAHLRRVLLNLLGNAVKYTDHGQVSLRVEAEGDDRMHFDVTDTGPGIAKDELEKIFQAFYQTETGIARGEGTGLGLAISRKIVLLMDGELTVSSEPGKGSTFSFTIPLPPATAVPAIRGGTRVLGLTEDQRVPRILVAEDRPESRQVVQQLLERIGCQVLTARNGREAVDRCQSWRPDLILMDMRMPVMDGFAATRAIRVIPEGRTLPIVALTASVFEEDRNQILAAGCNDVIEKPIEEERLFAVIGRMLGLRYRYLPDGIENTIAEPACDLSALPVGLRQELVQAAEALDSEAVLAIVARMRPQHAREADAITGLLERFHFAKIEALCKQV